MIKERSKNKKSIAAKEIPKAPIYKWLPFLFFVLSFIIYSNTLSHQYAQDDDIYTRKNTFIQKGISSFPDLVKQGSLVGFDGTNVSDYRPLVLVNFALEKSIFGNNPRANHFFNILFYGLICSFLFIFLRKLFNGYSTFVPVLITLLFLFHPIHTEAVANIKSRDELLCFLFGIISLTYLYDYVSKEKISYLIYSLISFFLCLLCKENGFTYLLIFPLLLYFFTNFPLKKIATITSLFCLVAGINLGIRYLVLDSLLLNKSIVLMDNSLLAAENFPDQLATNFTMLLKAISLLFFPLNLSYDYSYNQFPIVSWSSPEALFSLVLHLSLLLVAILGLKKKSMYSFAIFFYLLSYSLTSNLFIKIGSSFAERFLFAPSLAFCIALPFLLAQLVKIDVKKSSLTSASRLLGIIAIVLVLFAFKTVDRNKVWKDNPTLFASGIESSPNSARVHFAYANDFREKVEASSDMYTKAEAAKIALAEFNKGLAIYDKDERIYYNMGVIYYNLNEIEKAKEVYLKALALQPNYPEALNNIGVIYFNAKDFSTATTYFKKSIQNNKNYADAFANLGACYHNTGDVKSAIPYYENALKINPTNANVMRNLSMAYASIGDSTKANYYAAQSKNY